MAVLESYLEKTKELNILPPVLISVLGLNDDNELPFSQLEKMVQSDQILVTRLMHLANSPFYNRGNRVQNVRQIITRLGFRTVRSMVAMAFVDSIFASGNYTKFRREVWEHSIATGVMSQFLCHDLKMKKEADRTLLGGLLQDLGKIVMNTLDRKQYIKVLTDYLDAGGDILEFETKHFGVNSVELGGAVAEQWNLPKEIQEVISLQYAPVAEQPLLTQLVTFSGLVARKAGQGRFDAHLEERYENYMEFFGVTEERREKLPGEYGERLKTDELYKFCTNL